jgi:hypothetical protein
MIDAVLTLSNTHGRRTVSLSSFLTAELEEQAREQEIAWIKALRHVPVDDIPLRRRFLYRGDSLWWFTEIFLHKQQAIRSLFRAIAAIEQVIARERPARLELQRADRFTRVVAPQIAAGRGVAVSGGSFPPLYWQARLARIDMRAQWLRTAARASRLRRRPPPAPTAPPAIAAFIHRAFWRQDAGDGSAEAYIGPVLQTLEQRLPDRQIAYVSLGPAENFSARRWWHPLRGSDGPTAVAPIESFASFRDLVESDRLWGERHRHRRALWASAALRAAAVIGTCDCWPVVREELAGVALLQWPWSARAMDEAGAALDALQPRAALTYAEAGGWGRALMLECRRRGLPSAGLQHGFIYRHWLNYLHEADEMAPDPGNADDEGFPRPDVTLVFDEYAGEHLMARGRFPREALAVTGSPRLDALVATARAADDGALDRARSEADAGSEALVLVVTKFKEAKAVLPALLDAAASLANVHVAIKTHPAETPDVYRDAASGRPHVTVLPASAPLAALIRVSRVVVTVNSTVALDAAVLGVPALVIGRANNLWPFVQAGAMAGAEEGELGQALERILYDEKFRQQLERARGLFLARYRILSDGGAAERSAEAVLDLME